MEKKGAKVVIYFASDLQGLLQRIEDAPKSKRWKRRAKVGTRKRWYQEVSEKGDVF